MLWVGLTGGIGSGKSTASQLLKAEGYAVIDADEIAKRVVAPGSVGLKSVLQTFGRDYLLPDKGLDRKKMATLVFNNPGALANLESIIHPLIKKEVERAKEKLIRQNTKIAFYDVPLLFEKKMEQQFDAIILISCDQSLQIQRLKFRDQLIEGEILSRISNQMPLSEKEKKTIYVVKNNSSLENLKKDLLLQTQKIIQKT